MIKTRTLLNNDRWDPAQFSLCLCISYLLTKCFVMWRFWLKRIHLGFDKGTKDSMKCIQLRPVAL